MERLLFGFPTGGGGGQQPALEPHHQRTYAAEGDAKRSDEQDLQDANETEVHAGHVGQCPADQRAVEGKTPTNGQGEQEDNCKGQFKGKRSRAARFHFEDSEVSE